MKSILMWSSPCSPGHCRDHFPPSKGDNFEFLIQLVNTLTCKAKSNASAQGNTALK